MRKPFPALPGPFRAARGVTGIRLESQVERQVESHLESGPSGPLAGLSNEPTAEQFVPLDSVIQVALPVPLPGCFDYRLPAEIGRAHV